MSTLVESQYLGLPNETDIHAKSTHSEQQHFLSIAERYLRLALMDKVLSADEHLAHAALKEVPKESQPASAVAALNRFVASAQTSGGQLSTDERQLIQSFSDSFKDHPRGDQPGLQGLLDLANQLVSNATPDRGLTAPEQEVIELLLTTVRSGNLGANAIENILNLVQRLSLEGASLFEGASSGLSEQDVAEIKKRLPSQPTPP